MSAPIFKRFIIAAFTLVSAVAAQAGPGVSSGDEPKADFICSLPGKPAALEAVFWRTGYESPRARIHIRTGDAEAFNMNGDCKNVRADELQTQCDLEDAARNLKYRVTLYSSGGGEYFAQFLNQQDPIAGPSFIPCKDWRN